MILNAGNKERSSSNESSVSSNAVDEYRTLATLNMILGRGMTDPSYRAVQCAEGQRQRTCLDHRICRVQQCSRLILQTRNKEYDSQSRDDGSFVSSVVAVCE